MERRYLCHRVGCHCEYGFGGRIAADSRGWSDSGTGRRRGRWRGCRCWLWRGCWDRCWGRRRWHGGVCRWNRCGRGSRLICVRFVAARSRNHDQNYQQTAQGQRTGSVISQFEHKHTSPDGHSQSAHSESHPIDSKPTYRQGVVKLAAFRDFPRQMP
jgi:hypothetical protein